MIAEFYLISESFSDNFQLTKQEVEMKIKLMAKDFLQIRSHSNSNKLFVHPSIYEIVFVDGISILDLLYNKDITDQHLDRDARVSLKRIIVESGETTYTSDEVIKVLLPVHNEQLCHGLIGFNQIDGVDVQHQVVYNLRGWSDFRTYFLGIYPKNTSFFIDECAKYFTNLYFHDRNRTTISVLMNDCPKRIIYHLKALDQKFRDAQVIGRNRTQVLESFSIAADLDETASLEGNAQRKPLLTFNFYNEAGVEEFVCCEPHLKLCFNDHYPGDASYSSNRRIYFHEGKSNIKNGRILIGHIGGHL